MDQETKVAVITGAARGIGLAIARSFLAAGYRVALLDIDGAGLHAAAAGLEPADAVLAIECDISAPSQVEAAHGEFFQDMPLRRRILSTAVPA
jgi:meso-butanediol dehydrogenase/(S,S)-butanediol dehydrogenase/diacetyl reductase